MATRLFERDVHLLYPREEYTPYQPPSSTSSTPRAQGQLKGASSKGILYRASALAYRALERAAPDVLGSELRAAEMPARPGMALLDFGCGSPAYLDKARREGWRTIGADFAPQVVDSVRAAGHEAEVVDDEFWGRVGDGSIDRVRMNHVLEHLYDPAAVLREVYRVLRRDGLLHLAVPNPLSVGSRLFRSRWSDLDCPRHIALFPPALLRRMLTDIGFDDVRVVHQVDPKVLVRSWGFVLRDLRRVDGERAEAIVADPVRLHLLRVPAKLAAIARRSDRYHVFAVRR
jgi:SAM-dependent methyltransferase